MSKEQNRLNLINKLNNAYQVCKDCGSKYGVYSVGCSSSWIGDCDVCGLEKVSVTEARDYGHLKKGITELRENVKRDISQDSKKVAEYMAELKNQTKYTAKITQVRIDREDDFTVLSTTVSVEDEGGGPFLIIQAEEGEVRLDFEEFDEVVKAVATLRNQ